MPKHFISDVEMIIESEESGRFYPKVLTGKLGLFPKEDPQGWNFCTDKEGKIIHFPSYSQAEEYLLEHEEEYFPGLSARRRQYSLQILRRKNRRG